MWRRRTHRGRRFGLRRSATGGFVILDTALDDDLLAEGYARDVIRSVQDARKAADLDIADRIAWC